MSENLKTYQKTVRLAAATMDDARPLRVSLDGRLEQVIKNLASAAPDLEVIRSTDNRGNFSAEARVSGCTIVVATRCGQDTQFKDGIRKSFISYSVSAHSGMKSLERATAVSQKLKTTVRIVGAIAFAGTFYLLLDFFGSKIGITFLRLHVLVMIAAVALGGWLGERLGTLIGSYMETRAYNHAESSGRLPHLEMLWHRLKGKLEETLSPYEQV